MILVSPNGEVRVWESMSVVLSNAERYHAIQIGMAEGDEVEHIFSIEVRLTG
jgi:nuclear pore complex protein Nup133